ncbi:HAD family hydrolase [bacterium]|nr:HAD family hydrolase [bacterium]
MEKNTLIFDLDGTLLNTMGDLHAGFNHAISEFGYKPRTYDEIQSFIGNGVRQAIKLSLPDDVQEKTVDKIVDSFKTYYKEHMDEKTKPYDGITEMLKRLKSNGYKLAVVSNKYDSAVKRLCARFFKEYISVAIGEGEGIECKPSPMGVIKAAKELHSEMCNCVYIGDADTDILTAKNADIPCISVLWGYRDREFLKKNGGRVFAEKPSDIINIIEKKLYLM